MQKAGIGTITTCGNDKIHVLNTTCYILFFIKLEYYNYSFLFSVGTGGGANGGANPNTNFGAAGLVKLVVIGN